jgi:hypothetical protein
MAKEYVEHRDGGDYVVGSRVSLDSVVYAFLAASRPKASSIRIRRLRSNRFLGLSRFSLQIEQLSTRICAPARPSSSASATLEIGAAIEELLLIWAVAEAAELINQVVYLPV